MKRRIRPFWLVLALIFTVLAVGACFSARLLGTLYNNPGGDPASTVNRFFDDLRNADYPDAYACLADYASLGLEKEATGEEARLLREALRQSYRFSASGSAVIDGLTASLPGSLRVLDIRKTEEAIASRVGSILEQKLEELPGDQVYAESGYRDSFLDLLYRSALEEVLQNPDALCTEKDLTIHLQYMGGAWLIQADRDLQSALMGGET